MTTTYSIDDGHSNSITAGLQGYDQAHAVQWTLDARFPSASHPHRQSNARRECALLWNARHARETP